MTPNPDQKNEVLNQVQNPQKPSFKIKPFKALSPDELHDLLQLRENVFIIEQNCIYQDIDGKDRKALHVIGEIDGRIVAYARIFKPGDYMEQASIGRVVIDPEFREHKFGHDLMNEALAGIAYHFSAIAIDISAQLYLRNFYETHGFIAVGESYLEDGIPHIAMRRG